MATVNSGIMALSDENLNDMDHFIISFLDEHEWATPNLIRQFYNDDRDEDDEVSRQWVSQRINRLSEHGHLTKAHRNADEYQLVDDPREH